MANQKIEFTTSVEVENHLGEIVERYRLGEVVEMSDASARHWLIRNKAKAFQGRPRGRPRKSDQPPEGDASLESDAPSKEDAPPAGK